VSGNKNLVLFVSSLHHSTFILLFAPDAGEGGLDLLLLEFIIKKTYASGNLPSPLFSKEG
jgi:hypothetical protein